MRVKNHFITLSKRRDDVCILLNNEHPLCGPIGTPIEAFLQFAREANLIHDESPFMGGILDGKLRELSYEIRRDGVLFPIHLSSSDGGRIYRRSLVLLMTTAVEELWPETKINVSYAVPDGGFFCKCVNRAPFSTDEITRLEMHMRQIVVDDSPIIRRIVPLSEAVELFQTRQDDDKVRLLASRVRNDLALYTLRGRHDYYYGYMLPRTGYLTLFRLIWVEGGFILQYPRKETPNQLGDITTYNKLSLVFQQSDEWLSRMKLEDIGRLNHLVMTDRLQELILVAEALHEQNVASIAAELCERHQHGDTRLAFIAGPSSSGKTTFAKRLAIQLLAHGLRPFTLELDNYFVDRHLTPLDEHGNYDFEALGALNLELFNRQLIQLMNGDEVPLPRFDFRTGKSEVGKTVRLQPDQIIIVEGIHGLNPDLVPHIPSEFIFRIYVSALTALNIDLHNRIPTTDIRLLRRIVRDARTRGYNATQTIERWPSVRRGEKRNIFAFQENADAMFNSALAYELTALRPLAEPLLLQVVPNTPAHIEANRLLSFLNWVRPLAHESQRMIPDTSILREFIGGSSLEDYHPGGLMDNV